LEELGFPQQEATSCYANNTNAIQLASECSKHIKVDYHYIYQSYDAHLFCLPRVSTDLQIAYTFTKALSRSCYQFLAED